MTDVIWETKLARMDGGSSWQHEIENDIQSSFDLPLVLVGRLIPNVVQRRQSIQPCDPPWI